MSDQGGINSRRIWSSEQWEGVIKGWHMSGLTVESYCREHGITSSAFRRWHRKLGLEVKASGSEDGFIPVHLSSEGSMVCTPDLEIVLANGHKICLRNGIGWEGLKDFLKQILQ